MQWVASLLLFSIHFLCLWPLTTFYGVPCCVFLYNSTSALTSGLCRAFRFSRSSVYVLLCPVLSITQPWPCVETQACAWAYGCPGANATSESSQGHLLPQISLSRFSLTLFVFQVFSQSQAATLLNSYFCLFVFWTNILWEKAVHPGQCLHQANGRQALQMGLSTESSDRSDDDNHLRWGLWKRPIPILSLWVAALLLVVITAFDFQGCHGAGRGWCE